jgi:hypothetical protein
VSRVGVLDVSVIPYLEVSRVERRGKGLVSLELIIVSWVDVDARRCQYRRCCWR